jgi:hypothetical protein
MRGKSLIAATCVPILFATLACGASEPSTEDAAVTETADRVCDMLRGWYNDLSTSVNATMDTITDQDDPTTANGILLDGWDDLLALAHAHEQQAADLTLPYSPDRARLLADLRDGAAAATARLESERTDIENAAPITVDQQGGTLAGAELAIEGARAEFEPPVEEYDDAALLRAFADDDGCDHVVQTN